MFELHFENSTTNVQIARSTKINEERVIVKDFL